MNALYGNIEVKVEDVYPLTDGVPYASVKALHGKPFVGGDKWPIRSPWTTVPVEDLILLDSDCTCQPNDAQVCPACREYLSKQPIEY